jgi:hypothetical protein
MNTTLNVELLFFHVSVLVHGSSRTGINEMNDEVDESNLCTLNYGSSSLLRRMPAVEEDPWFASLDSNCWISILVAEDCNLVLCFTFQTTELIYSTTTVLYSVVVSMYIRSKNYGNRTYFELNFISKHFPDRHQIRRLFNRLKQDSCRKKLSFRLVKVLLKR